MMAVASKLFPKVAKALLKFAYPISKKLAWVVIFDVQREITKEIRTLLRRQKSENCRTHHESHRRERSYKIRKQ